MKKIFLFAAAAMVSLSSCVQTEDVYTGGVREIGFKSAVVRDAIETTTFTGSMNVAAAWDADGEATTKNYVEYFTPTKFTDKNKNNVWSGEPARYWPNVGKMQFLAHFPYNETFVVAYGDKGAITGYTATVTGNKDAQNDVLYSNVHECNCAPQAQQPLLFHHAMTLLQVNFATNLPNTTEAKNVVKIKEVTVYDVRFDGKLNVTGAANTKSSAEWSDHGDKTNYTFLNIDPDYELGATVNPDKASTPLLILPSKTDEKQTKMTVVFELNGHEMTKTVEFNAGDNGYGDWKMGYKYIYNFTISANEILFDVEVDNWTVETITPGITI